ncbi:MAG: VWA domain-containing protein [bacterium]|nr:VWA domain-containing protein [bacterium]
MLSIAGAGAAQAQGLGATLAQSRNLLRADRLLESGELASGELEVNAELALDDGASEAELAVSLFTGEAPAAGTRWAITLLVPAVDREPLVLHSLVEWSSDAVATGNTSGWAYLIRASVPEDLQDAAVAVENLTSGGWGAAAVDLTDELNEVEVGLAVLSASASATPGASRPGTTPPGVVRLPRTTPYETGKPVAEPPATADEPEAGPEIIKLIAPTQRPAVGRVRFRTVATMGGIRSAVFYLDGERVAEDERPPFSATLDLGPTPRARLVRVEAFGFQDLKLGEDEITVNLDQQPFAVRIGDLESVGDGKTRVTASVSVPPAERLNRVEFYKNQELVATLSAAPFEVLLAESQDPSDFLRVVAYLESGDSVEDARLFSEQAVSERIEVNLVEVYAVVSDAKGNPVQNLDRDRFRLTQGRREIPIERFALADEVPLVLGLIIDSSESMDFLMEDTKRAAARFLSQTVLDDDRAFLVDFDTQPRLAQGLSGNLGILVPALGRLRVGGNTALYDAVVYSLAQFEREPGRRALVLLTDGRDYGSKFGPKRALEEARRLGVPVYVIAISDLANRLPGAWMQKKPKKTFPVDAFLEGFSTDSGGRVFSIADMNELGAVYEVINAELRSQYLLAFSTPERLTQKELEALDVSVTGRGLSTRIVVLER